MGLLMLMVSCGGSTKDPATTETGEEPTTGPTPEPPACEGADHCVEIDDDGVIDTPDLEIAVGDSVQFTLGNRWQSIVEITADLPTACDDAELEAPWGGGLTGPVPVHAGGVVVRGAPDATFRFPDEVWQSDAISGALLSIPWRELEPAAGEYDFSVFLDALEQATRHGKLVSLGLQAGARAPAWLFGPDVGVPGTPMVTKATSGERCFDQIHPSFWHASYVERLDALQTALADEVLAHAGLYRHVDKIKISGVNLMTSETRLPVDREVFCGFEDATCSNGPREPELCVNGVCPLDGCGCFVDDSDGFEKCGRTTDDLPQLWADAGYRPQRLATYFEDLFVSQAARFPGKDINLMEIARAFPNVDGGGVVQGFADPDHVRALIGLGIDTIPERFSVLNAALGSGSPQDICMEAHDAGAAQIGLQTKAMGTWKETEPALQSALDAVTPDGTPDAVSFVEIYLGPFLEADEPALRAFDEALRARVEPPETLVHVVSDLAAGTWHYKVAGTAMTSGACHVGTITVK